MQLESQPLRGFFFFFFSQTNPITQPRVYKGGFSFNGGPGGIRKPPTGVNGNWGQQVPQVLQQVQQVPQVSQQVQQVP